MADTAQFPPGAMLDEKYRIDTLLSVGGMGAVYVGMHTLLKKRVAVKVLRTELAGAVNMVERFQREAVAASAIGHDNIVAVTDMGTTSGGVAFLVMELLEGRSLANAIRDEAPMPVAQVCDIAHGVLSGLGAAHRAGIVHRDMKPENVFLAARPHNREVVKILDFGISSIAASQNPEPRLTITGIVMGTPNYMAPEQARGDREIGPTADIYAVGVILYEMLSGQIPYEAENYNLLMHRVLSGEYVKLSLRQPDVPPAVEAIVARAMALNCRDRFQTTEELDEALAPFRTGGSGVSAFDGVVRTGPRVRVGVTSRQSGAEISTAETMAATTPPPELMQPKAAPAPRRRPVVPIVAALLAGALVAGVFVWRRGGGSAEPVAKAPEAQPPAPQPQPPPPQPPAPQPPPAATTVVIDFVVTPADATITVDGKPLGGTRLEVPPSDRQARVVVEAPGYDPYATDVPLDRSSRVIVPALKKARIGTSRPPRGGQTKPPEGGTTAPPPPPPPDGGKKKPDKIITDSPYGP